MWGTILSDLGRIDPHHGVQVPWAVRIGSTSPAPPSCSPPRCSSSAHPRTPGLSRSPTRRTCGRCSATSATSTRWATSRPGGTSRSSGTPTPQTTARAGVSYRVIGSVSLASGNPVGDPDRWPAAIERWRDDARAHGWSLATIGAGPDGAHAFADAGLTMLEIGDEAVIDMRTFTLNGPGMKPVRQSVTRLRRRGYTTLRRTARDAERRRLRRARRGREPLAWRRRRRARLLDGARPPRGPAGRRVRAGPGARRRGPAARLPQLRPVGTHGAVAGPDATGPECRQRSRRADGREPGRPGARRSASGRSP